MKINDIYKKLVTITGKPISQAEFARSLNARRQNINDKLNRNSKISDEDVKKIEEYFHVDLSAPEKEITPENISGVIKSRLNLTDSEYEKLLQVLEKDKYRVFLCIDAFAGNESSVKAVKKLLEPDSE